jgi:hypothetical protein
MKGGLNQAQAGSYSGQREAAGLAGEDDEAEGAEGEEDAEQDQPVGPPQVRARVAGVEQLPAGGEVGGVAGGVAELVGDEEVDAELEGAEVLRPADPDGDLADLDEEAREEDLRGGARR